MSNRNNKTTPPKFAEYILRKILPDDGLDTPLGDFQEDYNEIATKDGLFKAKMWYYFQIVKLLPGKIVNKFILYSGYLRLNFWNI